MALRQIAEAFEKAKCRREIDLAKRHALSCVGSHARNLFVGRNHDALYLRSSRDRSRGADEAFPETVAQILRRPVPTGAIIAHASSLGPAIARDGLADAGAGIAAISAGSSRDRCELSRQPDQYPESDKERAERCPDHVLLFRDENRRDRRNLDLPPNARIEIARAGTDPLSRRDGFHPCDLQSTTGPCALLRHDHVQGRKRKAALAHFCQSGGGRVEEGK